LKSLLLRSEEIAGGKNTLAIKKIELLSCRNTMPARIFLTLIISLLTIGAAAQRRAPLVLSAYLQWKDTKIPCGYTVYADTLGFLCMFSGCEGTGIVSINRYRLKGDTIFLEPFDLIAEDVFLQIKKIPSQAREQSITFYGAEGEPFEGHLDSSFTINLIDGRRDKWINQTGSNVLKIPRGKYEGLDILQLQKIFGVPVVFWIHEEYDYEIKINIPAAVLNFSIIEMAVFEARYLLLKGKKLHIPKLYDLADITEMTRY
jgi:hypothetical protein